MVCVCAESQRARLSNKRPCALSCVYRRGLCPIFVAQFSWPRRISGDRALGIMLGQHSPRARGWGLGTAPRSLPRGQVVQTQQHLANITQRCAANVSTWRGRGAVATRASLRSRIPPNPNRHRKTRCGSNTRLVAMVAGSARF